MMTHHHRPSRAKMQSKESRSSCSGYSASSFSCQCKATRQRCCQARTQMCTRVGSGNEQPGMHAVGTDTLRALPTRDYWAMTQVAATKANRTSAKSWLPAAAGICARSQARVSLSTCPTVAQTNPSPAYGVPTPASCHEPLSRPHRFGHTGSNPTGSPCPRAHSASGCARFRMQQRRRRARPRASANRTRRSNCA